MSPTTENKIVLVVRKTRLDELVTRFNTKEQARFYIEHLGADFSDYLAEDQQYKQSVAAAQRILSGVGRVQRLDREFAPNFVFGKHDTVVVLGQDGLVANILKYLDNQPVVGVNPDPARWEGTLLPFTVADLATVLPAVFNGTCTVRNVTMAKASLNTGQTIYGVNDIFVGPKTHKSARYSIAIDGKKEMQSSSGLIISTGLGSTGWLRSVIAGATGIVFSMVGQPIDNTNIKAIPWDTQRLYFSVREPWPSKTTGASITFGEITSASPLILESHMPENGVIFSDGIEEDYLAFQSGTTATIGIADKVGRLVVA